MTSIAQLGGYLKRKCDGPPGFECLWRGYIKFETMVYHPAPPCRSVAIFLMQCAIANLWAMCRANQRTAQSLIVSGPTA
ncbi:MAG: hypothetical protein HY736_11395 [Verrucomicrobia bacterium]|nr:hypothetical protein [Verrucomicrobiota bacterium]